LKFVPVENVDEVLEVALEKTSAPEKKQGATTTSDGKD
jgi:predicted ATP-dependent protease